MKKFIIFTVGIFVVMLGVMTAQLASAATIIRPPQNQNVTDVNQEIDRTLIVVNDTINVNSPVPGDALLIAPNNLSIDQLIERNLLALTQNANLKGPIKGSAVIIASNVNINEPILGNVYLLGSSINIKANIEGDIFVASSDLTIDKDVTVSGDLHAYVAKFEKHQTAQILGAQAIRYASEKPVETGFNILNHLLGFITLMILALIIWLLFPKCFESISKLMKKNWGSSLLAGLIFLITIPIISFILLFLIVAWPVSLILLFGYVLLIGLAPIFSSYALVKLLIRQPLHPLILIGGGIITIIAIKFIPIIGPLAGFLVVIYGIGGQILCLQSLYRSGCLTMQTKGGESENRS